MPPDDLAARALAWLGIPADETGPDVDAAPVVAGAVVGWLATMPGIDMTAAGDAWAPQTQLGAVMLTARLIRRRNSPAGIEAFTADGAAYVRRSDPDVASLLRLGAYARPQIG